MSYSTSICAIITFFIVHIDCQSIDICANPINGQSCALTCTTTDFSQTVQFLLGGIVQESCTVVAGFPVCGPGLSQTGTITTYTIAALSRGTHGGDWSCKYGASTSSIKTLVVNTVPSTVAITQTTPNVNSTMIDELKVSAECYCIFPSPSPVRIVYKDGVSGNVIGNEDVSGSLTVTRNPGSPCLSDEFKIEISNYTVTTTFPGQNVYLQVQFGTYSTAEYGFFNFAVSTPTPDECPLFQYAFWPCFCIVLVGTLLVIGVSCRVGKDSQLQEGSLKKSCGCCPSDNKFFMAVFPLCTDALCTGSKKTGLSTTAKNVISVVVFLCVAAVIGVIIAFGLGVDSGKCILALILSIVCGLVLVEIFTVSVYPHWPCLPEKGEDDSTEPDNPDVIIKPAENPVVTTTPEEGTKSYINCFMPCRVNPSQDTMKTDENNSGKKNPKKKPEGNQASPNRETERKTDENNSGKKNPKREPAENQGSPNRETPRKTDENNSGKKNPKREPAENQASPNRETPRSPQASASGIQLTTAEGRSPRPLENSRPLPAIGSEAKQLPPLGNEESALKKKPLNATLPEIPKSNKLSPGDTVNNEEDKPRKKKKKKTEKKKREEEGNVEDDKRDSQNSGGQANVEEEEQK